ncbi:hypothetical protein HDE68_002835 [Pedobacter cryoconitis]|uniref:DUF4876 domain-containing protein n=1 Tax=Pedobacter cryoconitis TaxID=188932 RepID=A0A7W9DZ55_9SPHI|nr:DUF4876 domain-containing protein [Pedobacter cryoconitis]MBB5636922.1 hypothetical protein [Pedobacter cryoconitis]
MMKRRLLSLCLALIAITFLNACKKDKLQELSLVDLTIKLENPPGLTDIKLSDLKVTFKELNSGKESTTTNVSDGQVKISLADGSYDINLEGNITYQLDGKTITGKTRAYQSGVILKGKQQTQTMKLFLYQGGSGFVIQEIFYTGTVTPEGKQYLGDKYFKIYNNSDQILYADGLVIAQSKFFTTIKQDYKPNIMADAVAVDAVIKIPGSGKEHPVAPGQSIVISEDGINHKEFNSASIDLSKSDFEMYYEDSDDVDNPQVPNMENVYSKLVPNNRGYAAYVLARFPKGSADFLSNYKYNYSYNETFDGTIYPIDESEYKIPNSWIIDAVNLSVQSEFQWIVTDPSLDMGWTFCGKVAGDKSRYGKSVKRKVLSTTAEGRQILKDTNNSTVDFEAEARPSLMQ